ncbi:MAG: hypothetical protein WBQ18_10460 [Solirubrobacteraceae bacterium]
MSSVASRHSPTPFAERPLGARILLAGVIPAALGALAGILLGVSAVAYAAVGLLAAVGSFVAGFEHRTAWSGADRGFVAGLVYGIALLVAHGLAGTTATVSLGSFPPALALVTALVSMFLTAAGATREPARAD